ncbi:Probable manganese-transporting ATPase catp-8 [Seminavis robusta]|uniref:Probable manganese-transporting ATPase catp-8 n=1 Tax=Seminavis robusta TaxID=568900 RepID=A0A9N8HW16_9STRA|nr:Probable manganese-transporting ATPase catp-8 [Seminavis robusta]|eukprot:Sro2108_g314890.1 Probable manganese-transporting ATPase catp-8 (1400) ;mRNA; r:2382-6690
MSTTLRHRRKAASGEHDEGAETEPLLLEEQDDQLDQEGDANEDEDDHNDGYSLTPLIQRSLIGRLDVGPFLVVYAVLIYVDCQQQQQFEQEEEPPNILLQPITWVFLSILLCHLAVVLMQQWSVSARCLVGYTKASQAVSSNKPQDKEAVITKWTHCLVEETTGQSTQSSQQQQQQQQSKSGDSSASSGIATVEIKPIPTQQQHKVAVVNFHDISFRCPTSAVDLDALLWTTTKANSTSSKNDQKIKKLAFHRVRFPVNLTLSFYKQWKGHQTVESVFQSHHLYGPNATFLQLPTFPELLGDQVVAPFFLFQVFCVALWSMDEYWYYAIFTLLALLSFESTVAYNRLQSLQRLRNASRHNSHKLWVYRKGFTAKNKNATSPWMKLTAHELLPGDVVSLSSEVEQQSWAAQQQESVPADLLLLKGNAVVDEALLTGESIPQIKVPFDDSDHNNNDEPSRLDTQANKQSILFGGTVLLTATTDEENGISNKEEDIPAAPNSGVVGLVLRTGFETAQGSLLRTIAHSSNSVDNVHSSDTFVFIFLLLCCAVASASLVLQDGWGDETRNRFRLTLHVVIIMTSVIPPELPMELSLAVTNSVTDLMRRCQVYCTEHYRIPWAGLVDVCCFDKTGTLTSDRMRLKGVRLFEPDGLEHLNEEKALVKPGEDDLPWETVRVMAACHSLAIRLARTKAGVTSQLIGDPLEQAVLKDTGYQLVGSNILIPTQPLEGRPKSITILHRFAFSSQLKRMTVLVTQEYSAADAAYSGKENNIWALTKGAPETILGLLSPESVPSDYEDVYTHHMSRGRRVLAMGYRSLGTERSFKALKDEGRERLERGLTFAGFLVLDCPLKPDSKAVISEIKNSDHRVVMITGDAVLTAAEVARQVDIIHATKVDEAHETYWLQPNPDEDGTSSKNSLSSFGFVPLMSKQRGKADSSFCPFFESAGRKNLQKMLEAKSASFCLTGDMLVKVANVAVNGEVSGNDNVASLSRMSEKSILLHPKAQQVLKELVQVVSVFARHAPHQKEAVVAAFNLSGHYTLYCGDGTNDTPSLKRAHVGISIISAPGAESKQRQANASISRLKAESKKEKKAQKKGKKTKGNAGRARSMEESLRLLREAQEEIDQVELGDASIASPFTSKQVSIVCCKNVLQQGRCTLVTMLQIYKILGINCLVNAMVLSMLSLRGVKQGDRQLTVLGTVVAALFFFVTRAKPLETLSAKRPSSSVLCAHALLSIALQFCVHFIAIIVACSAALAFVDPYDPSIVADGPFNPNVLNTCTFMLTVLATINTFAVNYRGRPFTENLQENKLLMRSLLACYISLLLCSFEAFPPLNDLLQLSSFPDTTVERDFESKEADFMLAMMNEPLLGVLQMVEFPTFMCILMVADTALSFLVEKTIIRVFKC